MKRKQLKPRLIACPHNIESVTVTDYHGDGLCLYVSNTDRCIGGPFATDEDAEAFATRHHPEAQHMIL
jgi:hypothetical protein